MMRSIFNPPDDATTARTRELDRRIRCFDVNLRAKAGGYWKVGYDPFDLPLTDPHGEPWSLLSADDLEARKGWCMLPEQHDALQRELERRAILLPGATVESRAGRFTS